MPEPDLNFSDHNTLYATHSLHAYAAKCPPQLVKFSLENYTMPGDQVLDPMVGSGTTLIECRLAGRNSVGFDIDPLALLISKVKSTPIDICEAQKVAARIIGNARAAFDVFNQRQGTIETNHKIELPDIPNLDYWFEKSVSHKLAALSSEIEQEEMPEDIRDFLWIAFSSTILTKVSVANARDIIHSRHHHFSHDIVPDVFKKFQDRVARMCKQMAEFTKLIAGTPNCSIEIRKEDARTLDLQSNTIDLVFTSPPYATALDYTRSHFLAVGWMKSKLQIGTNEYRVSGSKYIGTERGNVERTFALSEEMSSLTLAQEVLGKLSEQDKRQAQLIQRYFIDMKQVLGEIKRVLKPNKYAVIVVCPSHIRKIQIPTNNIFTEMAVQLGLHLEKEYVRTIDAGRRVLPYARETFGNRMSTEYVLVYRKVNIYGV